MKRKNKEVKKGQSLKLVVIFVVLVFSLIFMSFLIKASMLIKKSIFDSNHRFTFNVSTNLSGQGSKIISLSPDSQSVAILDVSKELSLKERKILQRFFETPIDGYLYFNNAAINNLSPEQTIKNAVVNFSKVKTNMTIIDLARMWIFTRGAKDSQIVQKNINEVLDESKIDKLSNSLFSDSLIVKENRTIQVINASDTAGLANRLSRMIANMGGNIVSVKTSSDIAQDSEIIYFGDKTYTAEKLGKVLGYRIIDGVRENRSGGISDIMIIIGTDKLDSNPF